MRKRTLCLGLLLLATLLSDGCCWCYRPFLFRRWRCGCWDSCCATPCCGTSYFGAPSCCDGAATDGYAVPPLAPGVPGSSPTMPNATPLVRARLGLNK